MEAMGKSATVLRADHEQGSSATQCRESVKFEILNGDCIEYLYNTDRTFDTVFVDPPDNIGLEYDGVDDKMEPHTYDCFLEDLIYHSVKIASAAWVSFNYRHICSVARIVNQFEFRLIPCIQTITFGNQRTKPGGLTNNYRPLWCISQNEVKFLEVREKSWRQKNGDKRADPRGKLVSDVFDFPRVTGNSKQRRAWHKTQLHEGLVERCLRLTTPPGGSVLDPCAGTGTTLRVCKKLGFDCVLIEKSEAYYSELMKEHGCKTCTE